jgi:hypothetical protein
MARRIMEQASTAPTADRTCEHPLVSIRAGAPATWPLCDPRLLFAKLPPALAARCAQARAEHEMGAT